jgi:hypothetical protein
LAAGGGRRQAARSLAVGGRIPPRSEAPVWRGRRPSRCLQLSCGRAGDRRLGCGGGLAAGGGPRPTRPRICGRSAAVSPCRAGGYSRREVCGAVHRPTAAAGAHLADRSARRLRLSCGGGWHRQAELGWHWGGSMPQAGQPHCWPRRLSPRCMWRGRLQAGDRRSGCRGGWLLAGDAGGGGGGGGDRVRGADGPAAPKPLAPLLQRAAHLGPAQLRFAGLFHAEQAATAAGRGSGCASAANLVGAPGRGGDTPVHFSRAPRRGQSGADFGLTVGPLPGGRASCARGQSQTQRRPAGLGAGPCPGLAALRLGGVCQVRQHLAATAGAHLARRSSLALWWRC